MMTESVYEASRTKSRRTGVEIAAIKEAIVAILAADHPMTLRGLFYRLVGAGAIPKTEREYEKAGRYLLQLRRDGAVPYGWIADSTRWQRKPRTFATLDAALAETAATYRRALWRDQAASVEIWCEKDTLAGVLYDETAPWDVPLMVCRGFSSETYLHEAASAIAAAGAPAHLYLLTDYDPSGLSIAAHVDRRLRAFLSGADVTVERIAVTEAQIAAWRLPTRPTKPTDSRSKGFRGDSVELDAIPAATLRALVRERIAGHVDPDVLGRTLETERLERVALADLIEAWEAA